MPCKERKKGQKIQGLSISELLLSQIEKWEQR